MPLCRQEAIHARLRVHIVHAAARLREELATRLEEPYPRMRGRGHHRRGRLVEVQSADRVIQEASHRLRARRAVKRSRCTGELRLQAHLLLRTRQRKAGRWHRLGATAVFSELLPLSWLDRPAELAPVSGVKRPMEEGLDERYGAVPKGLVDPTALCSVAPWAQRVDRAPHQLGQPCLLAHEAAVDQREAGRARNDLKPVVATSGVRQIERGSAWIVKRGEMSGFGGGLLGHLGQWLGAQWAGLFLGVLSRPEPPGAPGGGTGAELGPCQVGTSTVLVGDSTPTLTPSR